MMSFIFFKSIITCHVERMKFKVYPRNASNWNFDSELVGQ